MVEEYAVVIPCKDGAKHIAETLDSLLGQTIKPHQIIVVDDASKDETPNILRKYPVSAIRLEHDKPRNFIRVPELINLGLREINDCDYLMISGDDSVYPAQYAEKLIRKFEEDPFLKIASGDISRKKLLGKVKPCEGSGTKAPQGSGRMFDYKWLREYTPFPRSIGWESGILFRALQEGFKVKCLEDVTFEHHREYSDYSIRTFGHSMHVLGYPLLFVIGRVAKSFLFPGAFKRKQLFYQVLGYIEYKFTHQPQLDIKEYVKRAQNDRIVNFLRKRL